MYNICVCNAEYHTIFIPKAPERLSRRRSSLYAIENRLHRVGSTSTVRLSSSSSPLMEWSMISRLPLYASTPLGYYAGVLCGGETTRCCLLIIHRLSGGRRGWHCWPELFGTRGWEGEIVLRALRILAQLLRRWNVLIRQ